MPKTLSPCNKPRVREYGSRQVPGFRGWDLGFRVRGLGFRDADLGLRV